MLCFAGLTPVANVDHATGDSAGNVVRKRWNEPLIAEPAEVPAACLRPYRARSVRPGSRPIQSPRNMTRRTLAFRRLSVRRIIARPARKWPEQKRGRGEKERRNEAQERAQEGETCARANICEHRRHATTMLALVSIRGRRRVKLLQKPKSEAVSNCRPSDSRLCPRFSLLRCHGQLTAQTPVILISIDTLRADHLSAYGYKKIATPNIDSFADHGTVFTQADCQIPFTMPSHASMLTSVYPFENRVEENAVAN